MEGAGRGLAGGRNGKQERGDERGREGTGGRP